MAMTGSTIAVRKWGCFISWSRQVRTRSGMSTNCRSRTRAENTTLNVCVLDFQIQADHCQGVHAGMARLLVIMVTRGHLWGVGPTAASPG